MSDWRPPLMFRAADPAARRALLARCAWAVVRAADRITLAQAETRAIADRQARAIWPESEILSPAWRLVAPDGRTLYTGNDAAAHAAAMYPGSIESRGEIYRAGQLLARLEAPGPVLVVVGGQPVGLILPSSLAPEGRYV